MYPVATRPQSATRGGRTFSPSLRLREVDARYSGLSSWRMMPSHPAPESWPGYGCPCLRPTLATCLGFDLPTGFLCSHFLCSNRAKSLIYGLCELAIATLVWLFASLYLRLLCFVTRLSGFESSRATSTCLHYNLLWYSLLKENNRVCIADSFI